MDNRDNPYRGIGEALVSVSFSVINAALLSPDSEMAQRGRPVPAPRLSRPSGREKQSRSCSVPPDNRTFWQNCGRELNVDDGSSIYSESVTSLVS